MKILVTGSKGQLGSELKVISNYNNSYEWIFTDIEELDLSDLKNLYKKISVFFPDLIINCAAYTQVDKAESEYILADIINHKAVDLISKWTRDNSKKLIHISTDYVFDGNSKDALNENASLSPLNTYGKTKLDGEIICQLNDSNSIILRTSWVYSSFGNNFVKTMRKLMIDQALIKVVDDQFGSPTYAADLADVILKIIENNDWIPGIYHYSNEGKISWFDFAKSIKSISNYQTKIIAVPSSEFKTTAIRPKYSLLDKTKIKNVYDINIPFYLDSLKKCIKILKDES